jgi:GTP cyclohydrolase III
VIRLKSIFESLAEIMGFLAGFSFISRMMKHILVENGVGADADKHVQDHIKRQQRLRDERH